jgi:DNA-binding MarR family transcriptional regulator
MHGTTAMMQAMTPRQRGMPERDKDATLIAERALRTVTKGMPHLSITGLRILLLAAANEGIGILELATKAGVANTVASRYVLDLGDRNRHMKAGLGLLTSRQDPNNLRKHEVLLTAKGRALVNEYAELMRLAAKH